MATERATYRDRIVSDPDVLVGKPTVKGTRISVETVLAFLADNPDINEIFLAFPRLTIEDVQACLDYASETVRTRHRRKRRLP